MNRRRSANEKMAAAMKAAAGMKVAAISSRVATVALTVAATALTVVVADGCRQPFPESANTEAPPPVLPAVAGSQEAGESEGGHARLLPEEVHLRDLRQLTFGGENAEAYFSADDQWLIFQSTPRGARCDQMFLMHPDGSALRRVSNGRGRTTCGYVFPAGHTLLFSSTHLGGAACPPRPDYSLGYVWPLYADYDIFVAGLDGSNLRRLTSSPGYDAEATISRDGEWIVFTSVRDGDPDLYKMRRDGSGLTRLTSEVGYDGGAFFSYDGSLIVYRAYRLETAEEVADYRALLARDLIRPMRLEIMVMNADGSGKRQLTDNGAANFAPYFFPDGKRIIFASNMDDPGGRGFDLYTIGVDGSGLERITYDPSFDAFPMFDSTGRRLVWASNRGDEHEGETNLFIADWVDTPQQGPPPATE